MMAAQKLELADTTTTVCFRYSDSNGRRKQRLISVGTKIGPLMPDKRKGNGFQEIQSGSLGSFTQSKREKR